MIILFAPLPIFRPLVHRFRNYPNIYELYLRNRGLRIVSTYLTIKQLLECGQEEQLCTVKAWVRTKRLSKNVAFLAVNDGSCQQQFQIVIDPNDENIETLKSIQTGSAIAVQGVLKSSPKSEQKWELLGSEVVLVGANLDEKYPLQKKGHSLEFLREVAHLRPRTNTFGAVFRVRNRICQNIHRYFDERGFVWAHTPIITANDCEGAGDLFSVTQLDWKNLPRTEQGEVDYSKDFFGKRAHLTVSGQLEGEFLASALGKIYTFGPTFRAENSNTARHLAEFWMVEPEIAFADLQDNMDLAEDFLKYQIKSIIEQCPEEMNFFAKMYKLDLGHLKSIAAAEFKRISYSDAIEILEKAGKQFEFPVKWGLDLQTEHERYLTEEVCKGPAIIYNYPKEIKAFYMRTNDDGKTVAAMDVLVPGVGELMGGSQREERFDYLERKIKDANIPLDELDWYLDLRRYGSVPHAGFGLGLERLVMYLTGMQNIRDVILCPRTPNSISF